jgi:hypothetical protein
MSKADDICQTRIRKNRLGLGIPLIAALIGLVILALPFFGITLSVFNPNTNECMAGIDFKINQNFNVTIHNGSTVLDNENASYYVGSAQMLIYSGDPEFFKMIQNGTQMNETDYFAYLSVEEVMLFNASSFNQTSFNFGEGNYDGQSFHITRAPGFFLLGIMLEVFRGDGDDSEWVETATYNLTSPMDIINNSGCPFFINNCTTLDFEILGASFDAAAGKFDFLYANVNKHYTNMTILGVF